MSNRNDISNQEYVYITARSLGKNKKESYTEAGYSKASWYNTDKDHRAALEDMAMQAKRERSENARAAMDKLGVEMVDGLAELLRSEDEAIKLGAIKTGLPYILKKLDRDQDNSNSWSKLLAMCDDETLLGELE
jgi:hypothetical protein